MEREIKFRGKTNRGAWIYGSLGTYKNTFNGKLKYVIFKDISQFFTDNCYYVVEDYRVDKDTIGQYTGIKDKYGKEIYEGDILERHIVCESLGIQNKCRIYVHWGDFGFIFRDITNGRDNIFNLFDCKYSEVVGNIHDNPELLNNK